MNVVLPVAVGLGVAAGVVLTTAGLLRPRRPLAAALRELHTVPDPPTPPPASPPSPLARLGRPLAGPLVHLGLPRAATRRDLAVVDRAAAVHLAEQAATAVAGALTAAVLVFAATGHLRLSVTPLLAVAGCAAIGAFIPHLVLRAEARARRADIAHALSAWLDLVAVLLAGGAGVDQALTQAADLGGGPAFAAIRLAVDTARLAGHPPWATLGALGERLGIGALSETAATLSLAGTEGARIRAALTAKAAALRVHQRADAEAAAHQATERMALPVALLACAFLVFVGWPALMTALSGF